MHNKSFTADNQVTLIGGRNIAAEYFAAREDHNFGDLDVLAIGPVVDEVSAMFDTYWNDRAATPVEVVANVPEDPAAELAALRQRLLEAEAEILNTPYAAAVEKRAHDYLVTGTDSFTWAPYELVYDSPEKAQKKLANDAASIRTPLAAALDRAQNEIIILSPYFVPGKGGIKRLVGIQQRGVDVKVVTNSLAANNHAAIHGGYSPSRKPLLKGGVELYEVRADATVSGVDVVAEDAATATLHTKAFLVDDRELFIGSFNFDPRSAYINTELGVIIRSPEIAAAMGEFIGKHMSTKTYEVFLNKKGRIRWRGMENGEEVVLDKEPQASWGRRAAASFVSILPIKSQL